MMRVYPEDLRRQVLDAVRAAPQSVNAIAKAYGIGSPSTIVRWARQAGIRLPDARERMRFGATEGARRRWGDFERRRRKAQALRQRGAMLAQIAQQLGYRSTAGAYYAARRKK
jgi:transposase-like protein